MKGFVGHRSAKVIRWTTKGEFILGLKQEGDEVAKRKIENLIVVAITSYKNDANEVNQEIYYIELSLRQNVEGGKREKRSQVNVIPRFRNDICMEDVLDCTCIKKKKVYKGFMII